MLLLLLLQLTDDYFYYNSIADLKNPFVVGFADSKVFDSGSELGGGTGATADLVDVLKNDELARLSFDREFIRVSDSEIVILE